MALIDVFSNAVETVFNIFDSLAHTATYVRVVDDGWGTPDETTYSVKVILDTFSQRDIQSLPFSDLLQPTDLKGLIKGSELPNPLKTGDLLRLPKPDNSEEFREFHVVAWNTDPATAMFTILLREV